MKFYISDASRTVIEHRIARSRMRIIYRVGDRGLARHGTEYLALEWVQRMQLEEGQYYGNGRVVFVERESFSTGDYLCWTRR